MKIKLNHHTAGKILHWCIEKYGPSKINGNRLYMQYRRPTHDQEGLAGYYDKDDDLIYVNKDLNTSLKELTKTIIHEYTHYRCHNMNHYHILAKYVDYDSNPMEIEAERIENRDYKECVTYIKKTCQKNKSTE